MSIIQQLQKQLATAQAENKAKETKIKSLENDIQEMGLAVLDTVKEIGIDPLNDDLTKISLGSLLPKITMRAMSGKLKLQKLGEAFPTLMKYKYLLEKMPENGI